MNRRHHAAASRRVPITFPDIPGRAPLTNAERRR